MGFRSVAFIILLFCLIESTNRLKAEDGVDREPLSTFFDGPPTKPPAWWIQEVADASSSGEYSTHVDDLVAVNAKWHGIAAPYWRSKYSSRVEDRQVHQFIGYLEGRLRINLPAWWKIELIRALSLGAEEHRAMRGGLVARNRDDGIEIQERQTKLFAVTEFGELELQVPGTVASPKTGMGGSRPIHAADERHLIVAQINAGSARYGIAAVDRFTGEALWATKVVSFWSMGQVAGVAPLHSAEVTIDGERVFVFGAVGSHIYLQGMELSSGKVVAWWESTLPRFVNHLDRGPK